MKLGHSTLLGVGLAILHGCAPAIAIEVVTPQPGSCLFEDYTGQVNEQGEAYFRIVFVDPQAPSGTARYWIRISADERTGSVFSETLETFGAPGANNPNRPTRIRFQPAYVERHALGQKHCVQVSRDGTSYTKESCWIFGPRRSPAPPALLGPVDGSEIQGPDFLVNWEQGSAACDYRVILAHDDNRRRSAQGKN
jgi:hypothetical protein